MRPFFALAAAGAAACALAAAPGSAAGDRPAARFGIRIEVVAASGPNGFSSPYFGAWAANVIDALTANRPRAGDPALPSFYREIRRVVPANEVLVTGFPSWNGRALPAAPFDREHGRRLHFNLHADGSARAGPHVVRGTRFAIAWLTGTAEGDGALPLPNEDFGGDEQRLGFAFGKDWGIPYEYSPQRVGIDYGPDGVKGTADDEVVTGGPDTRLVDELFMRGSGDAFAVYDDANFPPGGVVSSQADLQAKLDYALARMPVGSHVTATYTIAVPGGATYQGSATVRIGPPRGEDDGEDEDED
jgi:hypothetical protein